MKAILKITVVAILISLFSCNKEKDVIIKNIDKEEQALISFEKQLSKIKDKLENQTIKTRGASYVAATFDIRMENGNYIVENIQYYNNFEYGFIQGFLKNNKMITKSSTGEEQYAVKVSCDKTGAITECPVLSGIGAGMRQARCVGEAVKACLDAGGCADVCRMPAVMEKRF